MSGDMRLEEGIGTVELSDHTRHRRASRSDRLHPQARLQRRTAGFRHLASGSLQCAIVVIKAHPRSQRGEPQCFGPLQLSVSLAVSRCGKRDLRILSVGAFLRQFKPTLIIIATIVLSILMTAGVLIASMLPLSIHLAPGGEAMIPLARALIGGMFVSTLLTLFLVPCVYCTVKRDRPVAEAIA